MRKNRVSGTLRRNHANHLHKRRSHTTFQGISKSDTIMDIIELMEETHKDKNWIADQIRSHGVKISTKRSEGVTKILRQCTPKFLSDLLSLLKLSDIDRFEGPPPLTDTYHWFFTDIIASTDPALATSEQALKILLLNKLIERTGVFIERDPKSTLILPTGDGMAVGFRDSPEKPLLLALELHKDLINYNNQKAREKDRLYLRIGIDTGPVYIIKDLSGKENVWGPGIIMARRVMDLAIGMNIIASSRIANDIRTLRPEFKNIMHPIGDYSIKHGLRVLIYNVYGEGFGNKKSPTERVQKSAESEEALKTVNRFQYNEIQLELHVTNISNMMTHHHMNWNLLNISTQSIERMFYYLDGVVPKDFPELNVVVKDEENHELEMVSLNVNKPYHKEFYMKLRKPLKPRQKGRWIKLEYDWEEPERRYLYNLSSDCKRLSYALFVPRELQISQKVVNVSIETGEKRYASVPASVKYLANETQVMWEAKNLRAHDAYRFDW
jgi:hypothetical protein